MSPGKQHLLLPARSVCICLPACSASVSGTSSLVKGSPSTSSLYDAWYLGSIPARNGFKPFLPVGGSTNESKSGSSLRLLGSGFLPVHGDLDQTCV